MRKSCLPAGIEPAAFGLPVHCSTLAQVVETSSLAQVVEQWTGNPKAAGSIPAGRQLFRIACF